MPITTDFPTLEPMAETLRRYQARVTNALDRRLPPAETPPQRLHEAMRYATVNGGKRIRACLVYAAGQTFDGDLSVLDIPACAVEIIHSFSLVHDDMPSMDDDDLRRGKPTCHRAYDEATALLVGDALQSLTFELLADDPALAVSPTRRLQMVGKLAAAVGSRGMAGGQAIDIQSVGKKLTLPALEDMHSRKTGDLMRTAVQLGALVCEDVDASSLDCLEQFGRSIGLAFQIVDDILDVTADTKVLGKPQGSDQARNKPTYPATLGLSEAKKKARELHAEALASLAPLGDNAIYLANVANYIIQRSQ